MCGIIGYNGKNKDAKDVVISGLKNLEYRGYDSAGIAANNNSSINLYKAKGKIANLEESIKEKNILANTVIGHTRWATHGEPNENNAHPHKVGAITLVHNGIIENYMEIKNELLEKGVEFYSSTDTEVACAYINYIYENIEDQSEHKKINTIKNACSKFRGSYGFAIMFEDDIDTIYATRKDSPLVIGLSEEGNFVASDVSAILNYTNKYILLEYQEYAKITSSKVVIYNENMQTISKDVHTANWSATEYQKGGYDHYMLKEIHEQPKAISKLFLNYKDNSKLYEIDFTKFNAIHIVACGSAMHAGMVGKYLFENYANIPVNVEIASEYRYKKQHITNSTLVIVVSQSGETADSLAALRTAKEKGASTLAIINAVGSTISRVADATIYTQAGPEISVATTKGYTTQVATFILLAIQAMKSNKLYNTTLENELMKDFNNIEKLLEKVISKTNEYLTIAKAIYEKNDLFFLGRGIDYSLAMEGSLKLKEISYMHSEAYAAGELKHGTISLISDGTPVIALATDNELYEKTVSNIKETKSRGAYVIFITTDTLQNDNIHDFADLQLVLPTTSTLLQPLVSVCALQLIAYETAKLRDCDIDKPKNLAKSVTVE